MSHTRYLADDDATDAARRAPGWKEFHRACAQSYLFFNEILRTKSGYRATMYTTVPAPGAHCYGVDGRQYRDLGEGRGKLPIDAVADGYRKSGIAVAGGDAALAVLLGGAAVADDLADILGPAAADEDEDLIG